MPLSDADRLDEGLRAVLDALEAFEHGGTTGWKALWVTFGRILRRGRSANRFLNMSPRTDQPLIVLTNCYPCAMHSISAATFGCMNPRHRVPGRTPSLLWQLSPLSKCNTISIFLASRARGDWKYREFMPWYPSCRRVRERLGMPSQSLGSRG